ncbi:MAG: YdcF family protein [Blautia sp.]
MYVIRLVMVPQRLRHRSLDTSSHRRTASSQNGHRLNPHRSMMKNGVPADAVLKEDQATFTWENAKFSRKVTDQAGINIRKAIICCKNYHARRALMYYQRAYPDTEFRVCPCCVDGITRDNWTESERGIKEVLAEVNRIVTQFSLMM